MQAPGIFAKRWNGAGKLALLGTSLFWTSVSSGQDVGQFPSAAGTVLQTEVGRAMGRCLLRRDRDNAIAVVVDDRGVEFDRAMREAQARLVDCLGGQPSATLKALDIRGSIAEGLLGEADGALLRKAAAVPGTAPTRITAGGDGAAGALVACAVAVQPASAVSLMRAARASAEEATAFRALTSALQECAPATGQVSMKPFRVRPLVAVSLYRLAIGAG